MEDDFFFGVFPPQSGLQPLSGGNLISPQFVPIADSKAAHNFKTNIHSKLFILYTTYRNWQSYDKNTTEGTETTGEFAQEGLRLFVVANSGERHQTPPQTVIERPVLVVTCCS